MWMAAPRHDLRIPLAAPRVTKEEKTHHQWSRSFKMKTKGKKSILILAQTVRWHSWEWTTNQTRCRGDEEKSWDGGSQTRKLGRWKEHWPTSGRCGGAAANRRTIIVIMMMMKMIVVVTKKNILRLWRDTVWFHFMPVEYAEAGTNHSGPNLM